MDHTRMEALFYGVWCIINGLVYFRIRRRHRLPPGLPNSPAHLMAMRQLMDNHREEFLRLVANETDRSRTGRRRHRGDLQDHGPAGDPDKQRPAVENRPT